MDRRRWASILEFPELEKTAESLLQKYQVPGCIIALARDGEIVYEHSFVHRDTKAKTPIDIDTVFGLASLTKSFTCAAIMHLAEEGKLALRDSIASYLPLIRESKQEWLQRITIHHLMTHTSGLPPLATLDEAMMRKENQTHKPDYGECPDDPESLATYEGLIDYLLALHLTPLAEPGTLFSYSNEGYSLLGAIITNVSGQSYEQYVIDTIVKPLELERTGFRTDVENNNQNVTTGYEKHEPTGVIYPVEDWWDAPSMRASGFLKSTARDMLRYADAYIESRNKNTFLTEKSSENMTSSLVRMDAFKNYGYGFEISESSFGTKMISHGGSLSSISSNFAILPHEGVAAIILTNLSGFPASRLMQMMIQAFFNKQMFESIPTLEPLEVPEEIMRAYVGSYSSAEGMDCSFQINKAGTAEFWFQEEKYPFLFIDENTLVVTIDDTNEPVEFLKNKHGNVWALSIFHRVILKQ